jgi:hypothetical protein
MYFAADNEIEALFHLPLDPNSIALPLTNEQNLRWKAIETAPYQVQEAFVKAVLEEQQPERERILSQRQQQQQRQ